MSRQGLWWKLAPAAFGILVWSACTQNLENNTAFKDQVSRINRLEEDMGALKTQVGGIESDLQKASQELNKLTTRGGGSPEALTPLQTRLTAVEEQLKKTNEVLDAMSKRAGGPPVEGKLTPKPPVKAEPKPPATPPTATSPLPAAPTAGAPAAVAKPARTAAPRVAKPAESRVQVTGSYYQVQKGDTMASIAQKNKISLQKLLDANRLPAGRNVPVGEMIYVPGQ